jgi:hypothetical protein
MLTALSISSIDIRTRTALRRASTPYTPVENSAADRKSTKREPDHGRSFLPRQHDRPDQRRQQQERDHLERQDEPAEDRRPDRRNRALHRVDAGGIPVERRLDQVDQPAEDRERDQERHATPLIVERLASDRRLRQHQPEQEQDHDRADVDQDLDPRDEFGGQQEVHARDRRERDHEVQRGAHDVAGGNHPERAHHSRNSDHDERDLGSGHEPPSALLRAATIAARRARPSATLRSVPCSNSSANTRSNVS